VNFFGNQLVACLVIYYCKNDKTEKKSI